MNARKESEAEMHPAERFWDKTASRYDQAEKKDEPTYASIIHRTKTYLKRSDMVLDCGCGTGSITNEIAPYVREIHAIDISSKMIEWAEQKARERTLANITYTHATIFDERLKKGSFEAILLFHVLHLLGDEHLALQRMNAPAEARRIIDFGHTLRGRENSSKKLVILGRKLGFSTENQIISNTRSGPYPGEWAFFNG
jgi:2-polyprenyl-3-methyl-5-hydroxy-6-metoxy-1,4-benzoquinol methylase